MKNIILGGGIGGLSTAYYLSKAIAEPFSLYEVTSRLGGWIHSCRSKNDSIFEAGPRTMRIVGARGANTLSMIEELGLDDEIRPILRTQPAAKNRMLYVDGQLHSLPNTISSLFKTVPPFSKAFVWSLFQDLRTPAAKLDDDTIHNFISRRFGSEIADLAVSSLVCGVCAGNAKHISVNLLMKNVFQAEQKYGSVIKGVLKGALQSKEEIIRGPLAKRALKDGWSVWSLTGGLETLPSRLGEYLRENSSMEMCLDSRCDGIKFDAAGVEVTINGKKQHAEHLYSALPSYVLSKLLGSEHKALQEDLSAIPFVNVAVINFEYDGNVLTQDGFGFLVPPNQNLPILGVIFDTCCFPQDGKTVLTVMMGGHWFLERFGSHPQDDTLIGIAKKELERALKIKQEPSDIKISILQNCIPQYLVGHNARVERIRDYIQRHNLPLTLVGSSYNGIGVNDVIYSAKQAVFDRRKKEI